MVMQKGILSIKDPRGRYIGMQTLAKGYLGFGYDAVDIDISCIGPGDNPSAIVLALSSALDRNGKSASTTYVKGDYFVNATDERFAAMLSKARSMWKFADLQRTGSNQYHLYFNNSRMRRITREAFCSEECSFESELMRFDDAVSRSEEQLAAVTDLTLDACSASDCDLHGLFRRMPGLKRIDLTEVDFTGARNLQNLFRDCPALQKVILSQSIRSVTNAYLSRPIGSNMLLDSDGILHRYEEYSSRQDAYMTRSVSDAPDGIVFSFAEEAPSAWQAFLGLDAAAEIIVNQGVCRPAAAKPSPAADEKPAETPRAPASPVRTVHPVGKSTGSISPESQRKMEEMERKNRRDRMLGIVVGVGIAILMYLIAFEFLG